jgi:hypothetical protein
MGGTSVRQTRPWATTSKNKQQAWTIQGKQTAGDLMSEGWQLLLAGPDLWRDMALGPAERHRQLIGPAHVDEHLLALLVCGFDKEPAEHNATSLEIAFARCSNKQVIQLGNL